MKKLAATTFAAVVLIGIGQGDQAEASNGQKHMQPVFNYDCFQIEKPSFNEGAQEPIQEDYEYVNPTEEEAETEAEENGAEEVQAEPADVSADEQQMVDLVNQEREQAGLAPLTVNDELTEVARVKAQDMIDNQYFAHESPTYGSPFQMMDHFGVTYQTAGENLAGNQTVENAHTSLMNSQGHRENILSNNYSEVGIGVVDGGPYGKMFVQLFKG
ncbi:transporter [Bacillus sp. JCM 19046]|nr:transporter [Bacillus sp. JCM 19046]